MKNFQKEIGWGITAIIGGMISGLIISVLIVSSDWMFSHGVSTSSMATFSFLSLMLIPFFIAGIIQLFTTRKIILSIIVGLVAVILTYTFGLAILFGLSGGGLAR